MSSKRKNTPTKLPKDDFVNERPIYNSIHREHRNLHLDLDRDFDLHPPLHIVEHNENGIDRQDSDSGTEQPQSKKQRILQSVRNSSDSESDQEFYNDYSTRPLLGLHKKSMESVLRKLNSKSDDFETDKTFSDSNVAMATQPEEMIQSIQMLLADTNAQDKEQKLSEMIAQLQTLKDRMKKEKEVSNQAFSIVTDKRPLSYVLCLTLMHSEWPKLYRVLAILSAIGMKHPLCCSVESLQAT